MNKYTLKYFLRAVFVLSWLALGSSTALANPTLTAPLATRDYRELLIPSSVARLTAVSLTGTFIASAERDGQWELYAVHPDGTWGQLTQNYSPARAPALTPGGKQLAFQSHKDGNWEIYAESMGSGQVKRLTNSVAYDGAPSWSPDGKQLAFESYRSGDLHIWIMNADGTSPRDLTAKDTEYDYAPAWSPQGNWIAYTSWATGNKQIFVTSPGGKQQLNLSQNQFDDEQPAWSPNGKQIAFVSNREDCEHVTNKIALDACQRREVYVADFDGAQLSNVQQLTFDGRVATPTWSPDGQFITYVAPRPNRQPLYVIPAVGGIPHAINIQPQGNASLQWVGSAAWTSLVQVASTPPAQNSPLYVEKPIAAAADAGHPYAMQELPQIYLAPSWGQMSSAISSSLLTLRARIKQESGYDFLSSLSDMTRQIDYKCGVSCDNLSWHKSGRAVDTQLELLDRSGNNLLEITREDQLGETYWRLYLRISVQDGTLGEPLHDAPWDFSYRSRAIVAPEQGGIQEALPHGYYVDITELAREYGWTRISSHDDPNFDWHSNKLATEYWHYQKTDGLQWYDALQQLYSPSDLKSIFDWNQVEKNWQEDEMRLYFKGIPPPPSAWKWFALLPPAN